MAIPTYGGDIKFDYSPDILQRHEGFLQAVKNRLGIDLKGTSGSDSYDVHATNTWHGKDAGDYSWDDLQSWDDPNLPKIGDIAKEYGFQEVITDAHGTGPHVHIGNIGGEMPKVETPKSVQGAVQFQGLNIPFSLPQPDYLEKYNPKILQAIVNQKIDSPQRAAENQMYSDLTSLRAVLGAGNTERATAMVMPQVQRMLEAGQQATAQEVELANQAARQKLAADAVQAFSESRSPMNQAAYSAAAGLGGFKLDPSYIQMSQVSPGQYLQAALSAAQAQGQQDLAKATLANTMANQAAHLALQSRGLDIQEQNADRNWQLMLSKLGPQFDPNAAQQANKYLDETVDAIKLLPPDKQKGAMVDYFRRVHPSIAMRNPMISSEYVLNRFNEIIPGIKDEFVKASKQQ